MTWPSTSIAAGVAIGAAAGIVGEESDFDRDDIAKRVPAYPFFWLSEQVR